MYLTREAAEEIIREISPYINYDLNIMDGTGLILASTDKNRVGTYHEGAGILISEQLASLIVESDSAYAGCRKGVNLPISFAGQMIGVVGITGEPAETIKYAYILQKMTEMLVYENYDLSKRAIKENRRLLLINDLIHGNMPRLASEMEERLVQSGISGQGPYTAALLCPIIKDASPASPLTLAKESVLKNHVLTFMENHSILCAQNDEFYIAISSLPLPKLENALADLLKSLEQNYSVPMVIAVGNEYSDYLDISRTYNEALIVKHNLNKQDSGIFFFNSIVLEFILNQIPTVHKKNLFSQVFKNCTPSEIYEFCNFITAYFECNGSLRKLAEQNFIHKNTVQYKINKLARKTGLDIRVYSDLFVLYLAAIAK